MANGDSPEYGTLVTAALLILALAFAGYWIYAHVGDQGTPLVPWFAVAAGVIVVLAIVNYARGRRGAEGGGTTGPRSPSGASSRSTMTGAWSLGPLPLRA